MKASIKFRDEQKPLMRAKIPINILNLPFQSCVVAGESKELSLNLTTHFESGPSLKFGYRPNDSHTPFSFIFKTGIGNLGSPIRSPLTMSVEFNGIGCQEPRFFIRFKPEVGDFSLKKLVSSAGVKKLGEKSNDTAVNGGDSFNNVAGFFPANESKAAGLMVHGISRGVELSAKTAVPVRDCALIDFRWGVRVPRPEGGRCGLPQLVMNKIGVEHVSKADLKTEKVGPGEEHAKLAGACLDLKKQLEVSQAENRSLVMALTDLKSDFIAAKKIEMLPENHRAVSRRATENKADGRGGKSEKKSSEGIGFGVGGNEGSKI